MPYQAKDVSHDDRRFLEYGRPAGLGVPTDEAVREIVIEPAPVASVDYPFKLTIYSATQIKVAPGTVNDQRPDGMEIGVDFIMNVPSTSPICILCTFAEDGTLESAEFTRTYSEPTETTFCIQIGEVTVDSGVVTAVANYVTSSVGIMLCPDAEHAHYWQIGGLS